MVIILLIIFILFLPYILALDQHLAEANALRLAFDKANEILLQQNLLVETLRESFYEAMGRVRHAGRDPSVVLAHLSGREAELYNITVDDFAFLATSFNWDSPLRMPRSYTVERQQALQALYAPEYDPEPSRHPSEEVEAPVKSDGLTKLLAPPLHALPAVAPSIDSNHFLLQRREVRNHFLGKGRL